MFLLWFLLSVVGLSFIAVPIIYFVLAPQNLYFTFIEEGTAKVVMRGGKVQKILIQWEGYTLNQDWQVVERAEFHRFGGLRFYGWWPLDDIYTYEFSWTGITEDGAPDPHKEETLDYILLKEEIYWAKVEEAEDKKLLPLEIELILTIRIINPYKALFKVENWLEMVINRIKPGVRDVISTDIYHNLIKRPEAIGDMIYERLAKPGGLIEEFREDYGVDLKKIQVKNINPPEGYREITLREYLAERERDRILIEADAEAQRRKRVAEGESQRIELEYGKVKDFGDLGRLIRTLEALERSPAQGAKWIIPLPGGIEILREVFRREEKKET